MKSLDPQMVKWGHKLSKVEEKRENGKTEFELEFANGYKTSADLVVGAVSAVQAKGVDELDFLVEPRQKTNVFLLSFSRMELGLNSGLTSLVQNCQPTLESSSISS